MKIRSIGTALMTVLLLAGTAFAQPKVKSEKEAQAIQAIQAAADPDARIAAVENLLTKFADTEFKAIALMIATDAAQQKGDFEKLVVYGERTLEADPKNFQAMLMLASGLAQRTREHDLDREEKLGRAEKLANQAVEAIKGATKPNPQLTEEQWEQGKKMVEANANEVLAQAAMVRKKYDVATAKYEAALALSSEPRTMVYLANAYNLHGKPDQAIAVLDKLNAVPELHPAIKAAGEEQRKNAEKLKAGAAKPPASNPAPPQVEIKK
jgi:uncharacterized protein HemY